MIRRPPRSTLDRSSAASDVYKRQYEDYLRQFGWGANAQEADQRRAVLAAPRLAAQERADWAEACLLYTSPSPRDRTRSRMPSSA